MFCSASFAEVAEHKPIHWPAAHRNVASAYFPLVFIATREAMDETMAIKFSGSARSDSAESRADSASV